MVGFFGHRFGVVVEWRGTGMAAKNGLYSRRGV